MGAELRRDVRGVRDDVDRGLALLRERGAPRVRPHDDDQPRALRLLGEPSQLLVQLEAVLRPRVDRVADADAAEPHGVRDAPGDGLPRVLLLHERVAVVELQDQRDVARELARARLEEPERGGVRAAAGVDGELEVVAGVVPRGVHGERAPRAVLEALVDGQDHHAAGPAEAPVAEEAGQVRESAWAVAPVPGQDLLHAIRHALALRLALPIVAGTAEPRTGP